MPPGRLRRARPDRADGRHRVPPGPAGRGHHPRALALRPLAALRLRRPVPVRGRLAARRAPRRRPLPGLPAARRAARPGGAARAARRRGARPSWSGSCSGSPRTAASRTPRASPTCCGCSARSPTPSWPSAARDPQWAAELARARRAIRVRIAGADHWAAVEDAGRLRDALGTALPVGVPEAFTEPVKDPLGDLLARYARTHGPFTSADGRGPLRPGRGGHRRRAAPARRGRPGRAGRVPPRGHRPGVVRRDGAAPAAPPLAGRAAPGAGAGAARRARHRSSPSGSTSARATACAASTDWCAPSSSCRARPVPASALEKLVLPVPRHATTPRPCSTN